MLKVDYPAKPSVFHGKDAIIRTYRFWTMIKCFFTRPCYTYPVVYTDGLISHVVSDGETRTPWGIAIGDYVIAIRAPKEEMSVEAARKHNNTVAFAGYRGSFLNIEVLRYVRRNIRTFNNMLKALNGDILQEGVYMSSSRSGNAYMGIDFSKGGNALVYLDNNTEKTIVHRPAIDISNLYY